MFFFWNGRSLVCFFSFFPPPLFFFFQGAFLNGTFLDGLLNGGGFKTVFSKRWFSPVVFLDFMVSFGGSFGFS